MIRTLKRDAESNRKEVQEDIGELRIETPRALTDMRKKMLDDLDKIYDGS